MGREVRIAPRFFQARIPQLGVFFDHLPVEHKGGVKLIDSFALLSNLR